MFMVGDISFKIMSKRECFSLKDHLFRLKIFYRLRSRLKVEYLMWKLSLMGFTLEIKKPLAKPLSYRSFAFYGSRSMFVMKCNLKDNIRKINLHLNIQNY